MNTHTETQQQLSDCELFWEFHVPQILRQSRDTTIGTLDVDAVFQITGEGGGQWSLAVRRGIVETVERGTLPSPAVAIELTEETFLGIACGRVDHKAAFFAGEVRVKGDLPLVLWVANLIPLLRDAFPFEPERLKEELARCR